MKIDQSVPAALSKVFGGVSQGMKVRVDHGLTSPTFEFRLVGSASVPMESWPARGIQVGTHADHGFHLISLACETGHQTLHFAACQRPEPQLHREFVSHRRPSPVVREISRPDAGVSLTVMGVYNDAERVNEVRLAVVVLADHDGERWGTVTSPLRLRKPSSLIAFQHHRSVVSSSRSSYAERRA
jgi:hypothetical protein